MTRLLLHLGLIVSISWILSGCASFPLDPAAAAELKLPSTAQVPGVPFIEQPRNHCGPASLAMAMNWAGTTVSETDLAAQTFTPGKEGTFQMDLIGAARRGGLLAIAVSNYESLLREVAAGHPVLVLQNLGLSWWTKWHYSVVIGYDLAESELTLHSGDEPYMKMGLKRFDLSWALAEHWAVVVLPPNELSASGDEIAHLEAAAALERLELLSPARIAYQTILQRWPKSLGAWVGLGNLRFTQGDGKGSVQALKRATAFHPRSAAAWHNLALAYAQQKRRAPARMAAYKALNLVDNSQRVAYRQSLESVLPR